MRARDLYQGEHWRTVLELATMLGEGSRIVWPWVASAGYGLVGWDAPLLPYSATFSPGVDDSVIRSVPKGASRPLLLGQWWDALSAFSGPVPGDPRRVTALAATEPSAAIVVVASPSYVRAMQTDLMEARTHLEHPDRLVVVTNRVVLAMSPLSAHVIPVDRRLRPLVGGSLRALNARAALALLRAQGSRPIDAPTLQARHAAMLEAAPPR